MPVRSIKGPPLKNMKYKTSILALFVLAVHAYGQDKQYSDPELHYSIKLPKNWRRLPQSFVDRTNETTALQLGVKPEFQAWFQRTDKPEGAYPRLQITSQICTMPTLEELESKPKKQTQTTLERTLIQKGLVSSSKVSDTVIDTRRMMVFYDIELEININDTGEVRSKMCIFPGKVGTAELNFSTKADDVNIFKGDFDFVLDSFAFEPGYGYQPNPVRDTSAPGFDTSRMWTFAIIGGLLAPIFSRLLRSKNPKSPPGVLRVRVVFALLMAIGGLEFLIYPSHGAIWLAFVVGSVAIGVIGLLVTWLIEMNRASSPAKESGADLPPPV
jgi:hypothetical protein